MTHEQFIKALLALGGDEHDVHAHRCPDCFHIWEHDRANINGEAENIDAHTCPACDYIGEDCYDRYYGLISDKGDGRAAL